MNKENTLEAVNSQWAELEDIHDVEPLNENDYDCLEKIRDVLKKHGKQDRFGVMLIHKHFHLNKGEVLMEYTDVENRVQTIVPVNRQKTSGRNIESSWILKDGDREVMAACITECARDANDRHERYHRVRW